MDNNIKQFKEACNIYDITNYIVNYEYAFSEFENINSQLNDKGFVILKSIINKEIIKIIRDFWITELKKNSIISSNLIFGQKNYTKNFFNKYQRHFDFYWNEPTSITSRQLSLQLHFIRNIITGYHPLYGLTYANNKFGVYLAVTRYPSNSGEMAVHVDPNSHLPVHYNLPLSFKNLDYKEGGLKIKYNEKFLDIEDLVSPGDVILFNGSVPHKIDMIRGNGLNSSIGRLQMFSVPVFFSQVKKYSFLRNLTFEFYGRLKYFLYSKGKGLNENYKNLR